MKKALLLLTLLSFIAACKKDDAVPQQEIIYPDHEYHLSAAVQRHAFKEGSYWVYRNDSTGVLDSVIVDSVDFGHYTLVAGTNGNPSTLTDYYKMYMHSATTSIFYNNTLTIENKIIRNHSGNWSGGFHGQPMFMAGASVGENLSGMEIIAICPPMNVAGNVFNDLIESKVTAAAQADPEFQYDTHFYFSDSVGLAKTVADLPGGSHESWSLLRWNVVR